jgi:hypothetical protein
LLQTSRGSPERPPNPPLEPIAEKRGGSAAESLSARMGEEYKIETYDSGRAKLQEFLCRQPEFLRKDDGTLYLGNSPNDISVMVEIKPDYIYVCLRSSSREADALFGLITRCLLSSNDHVVISEL